MRKTSAVPLRKETVRVTLKSNPSGAAGEGAAKGGDAKPPAPTPPSPAGAPTPAPKPPSPSSAGAPSAGTGPDLPDVTSAVPLKKETMRVTLKSDQDGEKEEKKGPAAPPAPAPTIPLGGGAAGAPKPPAAAPTVKLNTGSAPTGPATVPLATQPLQKAGSSQPLPKATVQLQQTQQLNPQDNNPTQAATIQTVTDDESAASRGGSAVQLLAVGVFLLSLFVLYAQYQQADIWLEDKHDGDVMQLFSVPE